jgi:hypothetical protein
MAVWPHITDVLARQSGLALGDSCIEGSVYLTWSTCSSRSLAAGLECPVVAILQGA